MTKKFLLRRNISMIIALLSVSFLLTACLKDKNNDMQTNVSRLMAFNLAPDQSSVNVTLTGNQLPGGSLAYGSFTGTYLNIFSGNRRVDSYGGSNQLLDSVTYPFEQDKYYSVFVVGTNNNYQNIVVQDNYDSLTASSGKAYLRYINAIPGSSSNVTVNVGGSSVINTNASFGQVSQFVGVTPGQVSIDVSGETTVNRTITLNGQKAYTVLLMGMPNQADTARAVQIRFIENGTVTD